jgi:hypothetical protein
VLDGILTPYHIVIQAQRYMAEGMGDHRQRKCNKRILPEGRGEITHKTEPNTKLHNLSHGPREHEILPIQVQNY